MSTSVIASTSRTATNATFSRSSINEKQQYQERPYIESPYETNDDDVSLARYMSHKIQLNQPMAMMNPWTSPHFMALPQDQQPPIINEYLHDYTQYHQLQAQYQQQQLYMYGFNGKHASTQKTHYHQKQYTSGINCDYPVKKTRPSQDTKSKSSAPHRRTQSPVINRSTSSLTHSSKKERRRPPPNSLSSPSTSQSSLSSQSEQTSKHHRSQQRQNRSNSPVPSLLDDSGIRRSSIQSHTSAASSSIKTTSDTTSLANDGSLYSSSTSIFSMTKENDNKVSLSKRIRGVLSGGSKQPFNSSPSLNLRRSPSMASCTSVVTSSMENGSSRCSWTNLFRKSSKTRSLISDMDSPSTNQKESAMHVKQSNAQKAMLLDSPTSSISDTSFSHAINVDLPSPASSTASPASSESSKQSPTREESSKELDYFGVMASRPPTTASFLQHGSPTLSPCLTKAQNDEGSSQLGSTPAPSHPQGKRVRTTTTTATMTIAPTIAGKKNTRIRFTTTLRVHETFNSKEYDRRCDTQVTCQRLTPVLALQIKQELNDYKLNEMTIHPSSRQYTQFFL